MEGKKIRRDSTTTLYFDKDLQPIKGIYEDADNGATTRTEARFLAGRVECKANVGGTSVARAVPIPSGTDLSARLAYELGQKALAIGDEISAASFDSDQMAITSETLRAVRREEIECKGAKCNAIVIQHGSGRTEVTDWRLDTGELVKCEMPGIGAVMIAQTKEEAMAGLEDSGPDLDVVKVDKPILNPRRVSDLQLRLIGLPDKDSG